MVGIEVVVQELFRFMLPQIQKLQAMDFGHLFGEPGEAVDWRNSLCLVVSIVNSLHKAGSLHGQKAFELKEVV